MALVSNVLSMQRKLKSQVLVGVVKRVFKKTALTLTAVSVSYVLPNCHIHTHPVGWKLVREANNPHAK
jgi:hypothetical protein